MDEICGPDVCNQCGEVVGLSGHYHCANCGEKCSIMGHLSKEGGFYCVRKGEKQEIQNSIRNGQSSE